MINIVYSLLFAAALIAALMVVFSRHAVYSALYLVVTMVSIAGLFTMINAQLAAAFQIIVYAGAIMVLFLFVIMLLNLRHRGDLPLSTQSIRRVGAVFFAIFMIQAVVLAVKFGAGMVVTTADVKAFSIADVALVLLTKYLYAFEITSVMLLVAVIGAMVLARHSIGAGDDRTPRRGR